ncbi:UDP-glucose 4-epimerase GalE [Prosthecomicrobium pneumaticum]|uniref:UDP-glucose 4-epimerase n=1 Tax=Prosthecomicrobium pneumaticum TaxID=81895 RepID=A0A7W9CUM4_9HYPH|nr:UDP-arabinose 4-epimerase [Prosthecomicrobium pneumaticum]
MNILVTGGAGFIGSHACKALAAAGHHPVVLDDLRTGHRRAVRFGPFVEGDIADRIKVEAVLREHRIDTVMHFAASAYVGESVLRPDLYYANNVAGLLALLDAVRAAGVGRIVFSSTCATFGPADHKIGENDRQAPINPYGRSKLMAERILADYAAAFGLGAVVLRYFNAAGSDPDGELGEDHDPETHLIPAALLAAAGLRPHLDVFGIDYPTPDGTCVRDFVHVCDLADAHVAALGAIEPGLFKAFNLGNGDGISVRQIIDRVEAVTGRPVPWRASPRRPGDPPSLVADASAARRELGWIPRFGELDEMIGHAWAYMSGPGRMARLS